jgi:hypothetical protein
MKKGLGVLLIFFVLTLIGEINFSRGEEGRLQDYILNCVEISNNYRDGQISLLKSIVLLDKQIDEMTGYLTIYKNNLPYEEVEGDNIKKELIDLLLKEIRGTSIIVEGKNYSFIKEVEGNDDLVSENRQEYKEYILPLNFGEVKIEVVIVYNIFSIESGANGVIVTIKKEIPLDDEKEYVFLGNEERMEVQVVTSKQVNSRSFISGSIGDEMNVLKEKIKILRELKSGLNEEFTEFYVENYLNKKVERNILELHRYFEISSFLHINYETIIEGILNKYSIDELGKDVKEEIDSLLSLNRVNVAYEEGDNYVYIWEEYKQIGKDGSINMSFLSYDSFILIDRNRFKEDIVQIIEVLEEGTKRRRELIQEGMCPFSNLEKEEFEYISSAYGGSLDVKISLYDNKEEKLSKYFKVDSEIIGVFDEIEGNQDISIKVDIDKLYNLISKVSKKRDKLNNEIQSQIAEVIGFLFDKGSVEISPSIAIINVYLKLGEAIKFIEGQKEELYKEEIVLLSSLKSTESEIGGNL